MITRDNQGNIIGETNTNRTTDGKTITAQTSYLNGRVTAQNVTVRDSQS